MAHQSRASSQQEKPIAKNAKHTKKRKLDFSDIPPLSDAQLKSMRRGRPTIGSTRRIPKLIQLDARVDEWFKERSHKTGKPFQALINDVLIEHIAHK